jgi:hypothetical protein
MRLAIGILIVVGGFAVAGPLGALLGLLLAIAIGRIPR